MSRFHKKGNQMKTTSKLTMLNVAVAMFFVPPMQFANCEPLEKKQSWSSDSILASFNDSSTRICDIENFLGHEKSRIQESIKSLEQHSLACSATSNIQIALVLVPKLDIKNILPSFYRGSNSDRKQEQAQDTARQTAQSLHNSLGVGSSECDGSGILLFLSIQDRVIYISTSLGIQRILTTSRLDSVIDRMKPYLKKEEYANAILNCIEMLNHYITEGPPSFFERWGIEILCVSFITLLVVRDWKRRRENSKVFSKLSQLDKDRALALKGKYECSSCPICLEDFQQEKGLGSDGKSLEILKCGHAFDQSCWKEWTKRGSQSNIGKCPICRIQIAKPNLTGSCLPALQHQNPRNRNNNSYTENDWNDNEATSSQENSFHQERTFRLFRLSRQYPRIVTQAQIDRWSDSNYNGSMVADKEFVSRDPSRTGVRDEKKITSFGGGRSSGGSGSSW